MIKVIQSTETESKPFPKLMKLKDYGGVFLFKDEKTCTCLVAELDAKPSWEVGETQYNAILSHFTDYTEPVTIQNA